MRKDRGRLERRTGERWKGGREEGAQGRGTGEGGIPCRCRRVLPTTTPYRPQTIGWNRDWEPLPRGEHWGAVQAFYLNTRT